MSHIGDTGLIWVKSFQYKSKLLEDTIVDGNNSILKNAEIAVPLKYLSNFSGSLEWTKHCVLASTGDEDDDADSNNIGITISDIKLPAKNDQKLSKLLSKGFER